MKKAFFFIAIILAISVKAQLPNQVGLGSAGTAWYQKGTTGGDLGIHWRLSFGDTTAANSYQSGILKNIAGLMIRTVDDYWARSNDLQKWNKINGGGSSSGLTASNGLNIVSNDVKLGGPLTASTTTISGTNNTKSITFDSINNFIVNRNGIGRLNIGTATTTFSSRNDDTYLSLFNQTATLTSGFSTSVGAADAATLSESKIDFNLTDMKIRPQEGKLYIDTLNNLSAQNTLIGWVETSGADRGKAGYITLGSGLNMSSGVLTASSNLTATYLGYGNGSNTLTGDANLTYTAASSAVALDSGYLSFTGSASYGSTVAGSIFRSSLYGLTQRAVAGSSYDWLVFSAAGNSVLANPTGTDNFATGGNFGVGLLGGTISAKLHIAAGSATAAPLKFNSGTNLTTAEAGAMEYNGSNFFLTATATNRRQIALSNVATPTSGYLLVGNGTDYTITAPGSVTGLPYIAVTGTSTLTGITEIDMNGSDLSITNNAATNQILLLTPNPGQVFMSMEADTKKMFLYNNSTAGASNGDALTLIDNTTGEVGYAANLAFNLRKEKTEIYANSGKIYVKDKAGNKTQISPHNDKGEWIYSSTDKNGVTTEINMIKLAKALEKVTGQKLITVTKSKKKK